MGHPQDYGVFNYLDDFWVDDYSFLVKKLHHTTISHRVDDIRGNKDNMCAAKKNPNKICCKVSREYIRLPTSENIKNTQK
jgi:hypothetical protein